MIDSIIEEMLRLVTAIVALLDGEGAVFPVPTDGELQEMRTAIGKEVAEGEQKAALEAIIAFRTAVCELRGC